MQEELYREEEDSPPWYRVRLGVLLFGVAAFLFLIGEKTDVNLQSIQFLVEHFGWAGPIIFVLLYIFSPLIFVPATLLTAAAGLMWSWPEALVYVSLGCNLGANLGYLAGLRMARGRMEKVTHPKLKSVQKLLTGHGLYSMVFVRVVPVAPFHVVNIGAGAAGVKWRDFFWATLLATMPGRILALYAIDNAGRDNDRAWMAAIALVIVMLGPMLYVRTRRKTNSGMEEKDA